MNKCAFFYFPNPASLAPHSLPPSLPPSSPSINTSISISTSLQNAASCSSFPSSQPGGTRGEEGRRATATVAGRVMSRREEEWEGRRRGRR